MRVFVSKIRVNGLEACLAGEAGPPRAPCPRNAVTALETQKRGILAAGGDKVQAFAQTRAY